MSYDMYNQFKAQCNVKELIPENNIVENITFSIPKELRDL